MEGIFVVLTPAILAMLLLQGIKWLWKTYKVKDPDYDFPPNFYKVAIPVLNILLLPLAALIDPSNNTMPTDWAGFARLVVLVAINSLATLVSYNSGYKPLVDYSRVYKLRKMNRP